VKSLRTAALALVLLMGAGCCTTDIIRKDYVAADRATYDAIAPAYRNYVNADPTLSPDEKKRRNRTVDTWDFRLKQAETPVVVGE
jgi:hypothetical protein